LNPETTPTPDRLYLQAALAWLDARLEHEVLRWQAAGQDPADRFRGLHIADDEALALTRRGAGSHWGTGIRLPEAEETRLQNITRQALEHLRQAEQQAESAGEPIGLKLLAEIFELSNFELWSLIICLAPALDLRYERIYAYLQDDVTRANPSIDLLLTLLADSDSLDRLEYLRFFDRLGPLRQFRLLLPIEESGKHFSNLRQAFQIAPGIVDWLTGDYSPANSLGDWAELFPAPQGEEEILAARQVFEQENLPAPEIFTSIRPFFSFYGSDFLQQELIAREMTAGLGKPLLKVKFSADETPETALEKLHLASRDARLTGSLLYLHGCDIFINPDGYLLPDCFETLRLAQETILFSSRQPFKFDPDMPGNDYPLMRAQFHGLTSRERADLWKTLLEDAASGIPETDLQTLAGQFSLTSGQIVAAASTAMAQALQQGRALSGEHLSAAARFHSGHHLAELATKIEPRYAWDDLVLPETPLNMLREMVNMVKTRALVLEEWGLGRKLTAGMGVSALFSGPPGTGKTLAAQIMANQLGIDLYRIDLSTVVSKYIGETEKNLEKIFTDAAQSNAILFFDEADTIFGKRSEVKDAHDRYANLEVGYLLQRMENYSGVAILATNLRANLDEAFTRRLQFIVNFPFPDEEYRLKIWQVLLPDSMPRADNLDLKLMAKRFKLAGGSIRNIIVSAAYLAASNGGKVEMTHLMHGTRREFQKMGRLLQESDFSL
jgi:hypothetical protein